MSKKISNKSITMSVRLSEEEADFLSELNIVAAKTPSEKLRTIIQQYKILHESAKDYSQSLNFLKNLSEPSMINLLESERISNLSSELMPKYSNWASETFAYFITALGSKETNFSEEDLKEIEQGLGQRIFNLMESILRMGVTKEAPCYDTKLISKNIKTVLELSEIIKANEKK